MTSAPIYRRLPVVVNLQGPGISGKTAWPVKRRNLLSSAALAVLTAAIVPTGAFAQAADDRKPRIAVSEEPAVSGDVTVLDAITVEARRYSERPVDVPVAVSVVDGGKLADERVNDTEGLASKIIGLQLPSYGDDPRTVQPIIRGVGTLSTLLSPDNSTAPTLLDGVPMPAFGASGQLLDVGQVDVLRGPQGTLFGRNSTAGAINITSVVPTGETIRKVTGEVGTEGYRKGQFLLGGAINEDLAGRFSARYLRRGDYIDNDHPGQSGIGSMDVGALKGSALWSPGDETEVKLNLGYEKDNSDTGYARRLRNGDVYQQTPKFERDLSYGSLNISHDFENFAVKSTTGFAYYDIGNFADESDGYINNALLRAFGFPPPPLSAYNNDGQDVKTRQRESEFYQELRLQSLDGADTKWVAGGVFSYNDFTENSVGRSFYPSVAGTREVNLTSTSTALYGDIAQPFAERFEIGAGLRYTRDNKGIDQTYLGDGTPGTVASFAQETSRNFDMLSGRMSLSYKMTDQSLLYTTVSRGTKSGGYPRYTGHASSGRPEAGYDATSNWAYEIGAKADLDNDVSFALAGFYNDVKDEALFGYDPASNTFAIENFDVKSYGLEMEMRKEFLSGFSISGGVALTESEITGTPVNGILPAKLGSNVPNIPRWSGNVAISYRGPVDFLDISGDPELAAFLSYRFVGKRQGNPAATFELDRQHVIDARVGLKVNQTEFYIFGENLVGDLLEQQGADLGAGILAVVPSRGRTVGVGVTVKF